MQMLAQTWSRRAANPVPALLACVDDWKPVENRIAGENQRGQIGLVSLKNKAMMLAEVVRGNLDYPLNAPQLLASKNDAELRLQLTKDRFTDKSIDHCR